MEKFQVTLDKAEFTVIKALLKFALPTVTGFGGLMDRKIKQSFEISRNQQPNSRINNDSRWDGGHTLF